MVTNRLITGPSGRSPAEIVGSNPTEGMNLVSVVCCQVGVSATR